MRPARQKQAVDKRHENMNRVRTIVLALILLMGLLRSQVSAQTDTNAPTVTDATRLSRVLQPPADSSTDSLVSPSATVRPERPEQQRLPQDIRDRLEQFERVRAAYLAEQRELQRRLRGATDADRDQIREQIRERRAAWLEQFRAFRQEARERLTELRDALPGHREALDAARDNARQKAEEARERRGDQ